MKYKIVDNKAKAKKQPKSMSFNEKELDVIHSALDVFYYEGYGNDTYSRRAKKLLDKISDELFPIEALSKTLK